MAGLSYIDATCWKYYNAGTADTLIISGTTLTNLPTTQSATGTAFYQTTREKCFGIPATDEIWIKFDVYFNGSSRWRAYNGGTNGITGITAQTHDGQLSFFANDNNAGDFNNICIANQRQTVLLHMIRGSSDGIIEAWVDGAKIYRYTGDVNHGEDFADIYLQSDGSGTFFSKVIISNTKSGITTFNCEFKPQIYATIIQAKIHCEFKPQIYATIIQAPIHEKITADLSRRISKSESAIADTQLKIGIGEKVSADVSRHVFSTDTITADTLRKLFAEENISGDTLIKIVQSAKLYADTRREVQSTEKIIGDTSRKIGVTTISADLQRRINATARASGDTCRRVEIEEKKSGDIFLQVTCVEIARADTYRKVENSTPTVTRADTNRVVGIREKVIADTSRKFAQREKTSADTLLQTAITAKIIADTMRGLREILRVDTCRQVIRAEKAVAKTVIRVPHVLNYILQDKPRTLKASTKLLSDNPPSLINTFKDYGVTAITITLSEKTLSDDFRFDIASRTVEINEAVQGQLFDYPFSFFVEETNRTELVQSVKGRYNVDDLLYTQFFIPTIELISNDDENIEIPLGRCEKYRDGSAVYLYPTATEVMNWVAQDLCLIPIILIDDFSPYNLSGDHQSTYVDLLNSCFSWTSRLPQRQINVFIRGGILYCIQRGKEPTVFDITNLPHSRPTVSKKLIRSLWNKQKYNGTDNTPEVSDNPENPDNFVEEAPKDSELEDNWKDDYDYESIPIPYSGTIDFEGDDFKTTLKYKKGLLTQEFHHTANGKSSVTSSTSFNYIELGIVNEKTGYASFYLTKKETTTNSRVNNNYVDPQSEDAEFAVSADDADFTNTKQVNTVTYQYKSTGGDNIYLLRERDSSTTQTYEENPNTGKMELADTTTDMRETLHVPLGNGWYGQVVYVNGECQGSNISHGKPGNKVSQFSIDEFQRSFAKNKQKPNTGNDNDDGNNTGNTSGDNQDENPGVDPGGSENDKEDEQEDYDDWRRALAPIADTSFPVRELDLLYELTADLLWLNRKIEETITVDLISRIVNGVPEINHIVDFTERVKLNGTEYYLVANKISFTPRKFIQKLTLIRWC